MHRNFSDLPQLFGACCQFDREALLTSPAQLGSFLALCKIIRDLEPEAQTAAINFALRGTRIPGWTLVRHQNPGYVETRELQELFLNCPSTRMNALLEAIARLWGNISGDRYHALCAAAGITPAETAIKHAGNTPLLRQEPDKHD